MNWLQSGDSWKACLWLALTFTAVTALSVIGNLGQDLWSFRWLLPLIMLINAVIWLVRARQLYVREKKASESAPDPADNS